MGDAKTMLDGSNSRMTLAARLEENNSKNIQLKCRVVQGTAPASAVLCLCLSRLLRPYAGLCRAVPRARARGDYLYA